MNHIKYNLELYNNIIKDSKKELDKYKLLIDSLDNNNIDIPDYIQDDLNNLNKYNNNIQKYIDNLNNITFQIKNILNNKNKEELKLLFKLLKSQYDNLPNIINNYIKNINNLNTFKILREQFEQIREDFLPSVNDIVSGVKNALTSPINNAADTIKKSLDNTLSPVIKKVNSSLDSATSNIKNKFTEATKYLSNTGNLVSDISKLMNTIKSTTSKTFDTVKKMDITKSAKNIINPALKFITEKFDNIKDFFGKLVKKITDIFTYMIDKFKIIGKYLSDIALKIAKFGKNFYDKYLEPLFKKMFGVMKDFFVFLWKNIVPLLKKLVKFIISDLPVLIKKTAFNIRDFFLKVNKAPLIVIIISIVTYIGLQVFLNKIVNSPVSIPYFVILFFTITIIFDQINNNMHNLVKLQQYLSVIIIYAFSFKPIKNFFKLSDNFGKDYYLSNDELYKTYKKNKTVIFITIFVMIGLTKKIIFKLINNVFFNDNE